MKISLITGCNAMDSKELAHILLARGDVVILTHRRNSLQQLQDIKDNFQEELFKNPNLEFVFCDITDQSSVRNCLSAVLTKHGRIDNLFLIAAMSHVGQSFEQKEYSIIANGQSYYFFLENIKNLSPQTHVYGSLTSELAGHVPEGTIFNEKTPWNPKSPYAYGKALGGHWIQHYREAENLYCCYGLLFNHSSAKYRTTDFFTRKLTNSFAKIVAGKQKKVEFGFLDFYRDEGYSSFYAEQMIKMLENSLGPKDYVISTEETHHATEYLNIVGQFFNLKWQDHVIINDSLKRPREVIRLIGDSALAKKELNWDPKRISFKKHLELMCEYDYMLESGLCPKRPNVFDLFSIKDS